MPKFQSVLCKRATPRNRPKNRLRPARQLSLEVLENRQLLTAASEIIIADDADALTAAAEAPGFRAVMVQPSGKVIAAGSFKGSQGDDFTLVRYIADGSQLDATFGDGGVVQTNFSESGKPKARHDTLWGAAMDPLGGVVVSGNDNRGNLVVAKYTIDGQLDSSFSQDGIDMPGYAASLDESMQTIAFDASDNVYVAGEWSYRFRVVKYTSSGDLDTGFGVGGVVTLDVKDGVVSSGDAPNNRPVNVTIYESGPNAGKILLSGTVGDNSVPTREAAVIRLNPDGSLDSSFDGDGIVTTNVLYNGQPNHNNYGSGVVIDNSNPTYPDRIVVAGVSSHGTNVIRYMSNGSLDTSFNPTGAVSDMPGVAIVIERSGGSPSATRGRDLAIDDEGRIVLGGKFDQSALAADPTTPADLDAFVVARLMEDGSLDTSFGTDGVIESLVGSGWNELTDITIAPNGDIWASGLVCSATNGCDSYGNGEPFDSVLLRFAAPQEPNNPPIADAGGAYIGTEDVEITFDASGSSDPDGDSLTFTWNFGDGNTAVTSSPTVQYAYTSGGSFTVTLTAADGRGGSDSATTAANIADVNDAPVADAGGPYSGTEGTPISFDGSGSSDLDGDTLTYTWDFGDGVSASGVNPTHTYATAGTYSVQMSVSDGKGGTDSDMVTATVAPDNGDATVYAWLRRLTLSSCNQQIIGHFRCPLPPLTLLGNPAQFRIN